MDWADGENRQDFLGFAIRRTPGFANLATNTVAASDWLPNRLSFNGPPAAGQPDFPSNTAPIQKFMWWDARLEGIEAEAVLTYEIFPVCGTDQSNQLMQAEGGVVAVTLPNHREMGIGTWFNRAVMSSQAFSRKVTALGIAPGQTPSSAQALGLRKWLANGMELPLPQFIAGAGDSLAGAIYHLTDKLWIVPALKNASGGKNIALVYDAKVEKDNQGNPLRNPNQDAIDDLGGVIFHPRNKTNIMHNKFIVSGAGLLSLIE